MSIRTNRSYIYILLLQNNQSKTNQNKSNNYIDSALLTKKNHKIISSVLRYYKVTKPVI